MKGVYLFVVVDFALVFLVYTFSFNHLFCNNTILCTTFKNRLCDRNFCVGGDGVIFALKAPEGKN